MDKKKQRKQKSSADVASKFKESVLISKKNFHNLLSMLKMATTSSEPRKAVMRSRTGKKKKIEFDTEDIFENENSTKRMSTTPTDSSHLADEMSFPVSKKWGIDSLLQLLPLDRMGTAQTGGLVERHKQKNRVGSLHNGTFCGWYNKEKQ